MSRTMNGRGTWVVALLLALVSVVGVRAATPAIVGAVPTVTAGGKGTDVLPIVVSQTVSYPTTTSIRVRFDPSTTYAPTAPAGTTYLYQATWEFSDGTAVFVVPAAPSANVADALRTIEATFVYTATPGVAVDVFNVRFRLNITATANGNSTAGPAGFVDREIRFAPTNDFPNADIVQVSSPATGLLPYTLTVTPSASKDGDGYIIWAAIDWGDGTSERLTIALPSDPALNISHTYSQAGVYKVTLNVIDNGRLPFPSADPAGLPAPGDVVGVYNAFIATQGPNPDQQSRLSQDFLFVQVPGSMVTVKSDFQLDFKRANSDRFRGDFKPNIILENIASTDVTLTLGTLALPAFKTDARGRFSGLGLKFDFNVRKQRVKLQIDKRALTAFFGQTNTSIVNGNVDIPITIAVAGTTTPLATTIRYVYNSQKDKRGQGREGQSYPSGN